LWQAGGDFYNAEKTAATLDTPEAARALAFFRDLYTRYDMPKTAVPLEQGLRTGDFPLALSGNWKIVSLVAGAPDIAGKWTIGLLPKGPSGRRTGFLGGRTIGIFARSRHRQEAWQLLQFLFTPEASKRLYEDGLATYDAYLPPNMGSWDQLSLEPALKVVLKQQAQEAKGPPAVVGWTETTHVLESAIQNVILKGTDPKAELAVVNQEMNRNLKK
jgi:lactose/L-arabinose transport system substrate-binding protein